MSTRRVNPAELAIATAAHIRERESPRAQRAQQVLVEGAHRSRASAARVICCRLNTSTPPCKACTLPPISTVAAAHRSG